MNPVYNETPASQMGYEYWYVSDRCELAMQTYQQELAKYFDTIARTSAQSTQCNVM